MIEIINSDGDKVLRVNDDGTDEVLDEEYFENISEEDEETYVLENDGEIIEKEEQ